MKNETLFTGNLITLNSDTYPGLGAYWLQLRYIDDPDKVFARVYGSTPEETRTNAERICNAFNENCNIFENGID